MVFLDYNNSSFNEKKELIQSPEDIIKLEILSDFFNARDILYQLLNRELPIDAVNKYINQIRVILDLTKPFVNTKNKKYINEEFEKIQSLLELFYRDNRIKGQIIKGRLPTKLLDHLLYETGYLLTLIGIYKISKVEPSELAKTSEES